MACNLAGSWKLLKGNWPLSLPVEASMKINAFSYSETARRPDDAPRESYRTDDFRGYCLRTGVPGFWEVRFWAPKSANGWVLTVPQVP